MRCAMCVCVCGVCAVCTLHTLRMLCTHSVQLAHQRKKKKTGEFSLLLLFAVFKLVLLCNNHAVVAFFPSLSLGIISCRSYHFIYAVRRLCAHFDFHAMQICVCTCRLVLAYSHKMYYVTFDYINNSFANISSAKNGQQKTGDAFMY